MTTYTITIDDITYTLTPQVGRYSMKDRLAISFFDDEGPFCHLTVNLPDAHLNEGEVFIKDWSENAPLVEALVESGWLIPTGREVSSGYVSPKAMRPAGPLADFVASQVGS